MLSGSDPLLRRRQPIPWRLPGPDLQRLADTSLCVGYLSTATLRIIGPGGGGPPAPTPPPNPPPRGPPRRVREQTPDPPPTR
jgi:hypothetical protein